LLITQNFLIPFSKQFRFLDLCLYELSDLAPFFQLPKGQLELLELLQLEIQIPYHFLSGDIDAQYNTNPLIVFEAAPRLHMLALEIFYPRGDYDLSILRFPWMQITHLVLGRHVSAISWVAIIRQCPNIQRCWVMLGSAHEDISFHLEPMVLPHFIDFSMVFIGLAFPTVMQGLSCPSLTTLQLASSHPDVGFQSTFQPTQFYCQLSSLHTLILIRQSILPSDLINLLWTTSLLVELELDCGFNYNILMDSLTYYPDSHDIIVGRLERLTIHVLSYMRVLPVIFSPATYVTMVSSRWYSDDCLSTMPRIARLQQLSLVLDDECYEVAAEVNRLLAPLKAQGLLHSTSILSIGELKINLLELPHISQWE
jgi:hypothetical protein